MDGLALLSSSIPPKLFENTSLVAIDLDPDERSPLQLHHISEVNIHNSSPLKEACQKEHLKDTRSK